MSTSSLFLIPRIHTEFLVIIFDRAENRSSTLVWETRGDCCLKSLKEKQIILYSQHLKKNFSSISSRKEKNTWNIVKITFSCGNHNIFMFFFVLLTRVAEQGHHSRPKDHRKRSPFFKFQAKYLCLELETYPWLPKRNIKAILRGYFSSLRFDSGKIFKIMTFSRGARTTYCTF